MASAVGLRGDFDGTGVVRLARLSGHANQVRRLLAVAVIYDGGARHEAARVGGVGLQAVRDWVLRFNAQGPDGLLDGKAPGPRPVLGPEHKRALAEVIEQGPIPACQTASKRDPRSVAGSMDGVDIFIASRQAADGSGSAARVARISPSHPYIQEEILEDGVTRLNLLRQVLLQRRADCRR